MSTPEPEDPAAAMIREAFEAFEAWVAVNDPDGEMDIVEQAAAYAKAMEDVA